MRPRLPPEPWLSSTAAPLREGTYQAESLRPSRMAMRTSSCGMPTADSSMAQRGAWVIWLPAMNGITPSDQIDHGAGDPAEHVSGAPGEAGAPGRPRGGGGGGDAGGDEQQPAEDVSDARDVAPVGPGVDHVQAVGDDAEHEHHQPDDDAERQPRRPRHVRLGQGPCRRDGDDHRDADCRRVRPREGQIEQMGRDEGEAREQERTLGARDPLAPAAARRGGRDGPGLRLGALGVQRDRRHGITIAHGRPSRHRTNPPRGLDSTGV